MKVVSNSVNDTLRIGKSIAKNLRKGDIICLFGKLGSGKTVFAKGIAAGLGIDQYDVASPTFVLIREFREARIPLFHFDLYRLKSTRDILRLGYEEYLYDDGITVIEWADRLKGLLPKEYLKIELAIKDKYRRILKFTPSGQVYKKRFKKLRMIE
ncbi:MAG: tRNA (adenosine(37)-N6)-threonylcarbamoyltransferase complex ATPase subunit type 1 TsaE [Candidatus Omnitrophota bacterium]